MILTNLNKPLVTIKGDSIMLTAEKEFLKKDALIVMCEKFNNNNIVGGKLKAYALGIKIFQAGDELEINNDEAKLLKQILELECMV